MHISPNAIPPHEQAEVLSFRFADARDELVRNLPQLLGRLCVATFTHFLIAAAVRVELVFGRTYAS